jgi:hypothetical protein
VRARGQAYCQIYCQKRGEEGSLGDAEPQIFHELTDFYRRLRGFDKIAQRFWTTRMRRSGAKRRIRGVAANNPTLSATFFRFFNT